jgi:hypothetical protein
MYMMWYDDSTKKTAASKIEEAVAAYIRHFKTKPNIVLVHQSDLEPVSGVRVRSVNYVRRNNFWVGWEDPKAAPELIAELAS